MKGRKQHPPMETTFNLYVQQGTSNYRTSFKPDNECRENKTWIMRRHNGTEDQKTIAWTTKEGVGSVTVCVA